MRVGPVIRFLALGFLASSAPAFAADMRLPNLGADPAKISISGLSSGAVMAIQYDVAYSGSVIGVGVIAGVPYNCALLSGPNALANLAGCMAGTSSGAASSAAARGLFGL